MKVAFVGSRGIPANYGGFETFVEQVSLKLVQKHGIEVYVVSDKSQKAKVNGIKEYQGVKIIYSNYDKGLNPNLFYFDSFLKTMFKTDIIYSCGVAGAFSSPLPILLGKTLMVNPDGLGWKRQKWSKWKKKALYLMFWVSSKITPHLVNDSEGIRNEMTREFGRKKNSHMIEYGALPNEVLREDSQDHEEFLQSYNISPNNYHLVVARLEPENNVHIIIEGYLKSNQKYPLIVVGNLMDNNYVNNLKIQANKSPNIKLIGGVYGGNKLAVLRAFALSYFHGHSVGGTNPSLLEAMGSKNFTFAHDNIFNREALKENAYFFSNSDQLSKQINQFEIEPKSESFNIDRNEVYNRILNYYNWDYISERYAKLFKSVNG